MTELLTVSQKLEFLWKDVLKFVKEGIEQGGYPKSILANFKPLTKRQIHGLISEAKRSPDCSTCTSNCCTRIDGKILLTLKDVARLVDAGKADAITGTYRGFAAILDRYLTERDPNVFNMANVMMSEKMNDASYMPSLKKDGDRCVLLDSSNKCSAYDIRPESCRRYPFEFDHTTHWVTWNTACPSTAPLKEGEEEKVIDEVLSSENERLRDIALIMLNKEALAEIGYKDYL